MTVIEVAIGPGNPPGTFRVDVTSPAVGEASATVELDADALLARREQLQLELLASAAPAGGVPQIERMLRDTGQVLFTGLLGTGEVAGRYRAAQAVAAERGQGLQVVLRIDTPALAGLPWEAMYDDSAGAYVCRNDQLVRHVPVASVPAPLLVRPPLRILGVVSSPRDPDLAVLDVKKEKDQLAQALARPVGQGLAELHWAPSATWAGLQDLLLGEEWHVVHFIGHGDFDPHRDEGVLGLVGEDGRADWVAAQRFTSLLRQARPMPRLVVLNSCSGAATGATDLFSGTAASLVRGGIPAVAAMQYKISDPAAIAFARGFYAAIAHGRGVDDAVSSGRIAILGVSDRTLEWVTPVLYLRGHDTRLFTLPAPAERRGRNTAGTKDAGTAPQGQPGGTIIPDAAGDDPGQDSSTVRARTRFFGSLRLPKPRRQDSPADRPRPPTPQPSAAQSHSGHQPAVLGPSRVVRVLTGHPSSVTGVAFSPDGTLVATVGRKGAAWLWEVSSGKPVRPLVGHTSRVTGVAFSPDGTLLATASMDRTAMLWEVSSGALVHTLTAGKSSLFALFAVAFSPDGTYLATGSVHATWLWEVSSGALARTLTSFLPVRAVAFSPDGTLLATTDENDSKVRLWEVSSGALARTLTSFGQVRAVAFSPDGTLLATTSNQFNGTVRLWDVDSGKQVRGMTGHTSAVDGVAFSPDGTLLATAGNADGAWLWQVASGTLVRTLTGHADGVNGVAFSPDGTLLATAGSDKTARLWG